MPSPKNRFEAAFLKISAMSTLPVGMPEIIDNVPYLISAFTERHDPSTGNYHKQRGIGYVSIGSLNPAGEKIIDHHRIFVGDDGLVPVQFSVLSGPGLRVTPRPTPPIPETSYKDVTLNMLDFVEDALRSAKTDPKTVFRI